MLIPRFSPRPLALLTFAALASLLTGGCSVTGLYADEDFACPMEAGFPCESTAVAYQKSVSGEYALEDEARRAAAARERAEAQKGLIGKIRDRLSADTRPTAESAHEPASAAEPAGGRNARTNTSQAARSLRLRDTDVSTAGHAADYDPAIVVTNLSARPERLPEEIVTIWIAPWTDSEGDFHEGEKIHARVFDARWAAARRRAEEARGGRAVVALPFAGRTPNQDLTARTRTAEPRTVRIDEESVGLSMPAVSALVGRGAAELEASKREIGKTAEQLGRH